MTAAEAGSTPSIQGAVLFSVVLVLVGISGALVERTLVPAGVGLLPRLALFPSIALVLLLVWLKAGGHDVRSSLFLQLPSLPSFLGIGLVASGAWVVGAVVGILQRAAIPALAPSEAAEKAFKAELQQAPLLGIIVVLVLLTPIAEEAAFRGFVLSGLRSGLGASMAVLVSSLIFGLLHIYTLDTVGNLSFSGARVLPRRHLAPWLPLPCWYLDHSWEGWPSFGYATVGRLGGSGNYWVR
ncbi:MAG: CPBP family intramembrane metalloprotease [Actinobacteria bacterium]|nr:CPBP family intramembrane metalloprotease [Actinomycetota bacterium]